MDKLKMHSPDLSQDNIAKIRELFPGCVTEALDEATGAVRLAVDFDQLRQELSDHIVEGPQERYRLDWPGKREALALANAPIAKTLRPCREESVDFDNTRNLFIEGDNLEALKLLQENYLGKVKMVYIDPPYNTGNDFVYEDDFAESSADFLERSNQMDDEGNRLVANSTSNGRFHSDWLSMIYSRLKVASNLLSDDGIIFASIDDNEFENLRKVCDEVFGKENLLGVFQWRRRQTTDNRNFTRVSFDNEYIVAYSKSDKGRLKGRDIDIEKYKNPDNDPRGPWASIDLSGLATAAQRPNLHYDIVDPATGNVFPPNPNRGWSKSKDNVEKMIEEGRILFPSKPEGRPREKKFLANLQSSVTGFSTWLDSNQVGFNTNGTRQVTELLGGKYFDFPKPTELITTFIEQAATDKGDIVIDFFAGSSSTAHALLETSARDGIDRHFVMIQIAEGLAATSDAAKAGYRTIAEISKERIRRAGEKILEGECHPDWNRDVGFRVLKVDTSNMKDVYYRPDELKQSDLLDMVDNVKEGRTAEDLLFQVLVDWGVDLTLPIRRETVQGKTVFFVDDNALVACFESGITEDLVKELAGHEPLRVVFRDNGFVSDAVKINVTQIFRQLSPSNEVKAI